MCVCVCVGVCGGTAPSHLAGLHEELYELAAHHGEVPGPGVVQLQPRVQLAAGLVEVQEPPHEPGGSATEMDNRSIILIILCRKRQ